LLFSNNADTPLEAASTTKIMTAFLVIRLADKNPTVLNERLRFSRRADETVGSTSAIQAGESVSVRESLFGLLLPSGNDASVALAEHFGSRLAGNLNNHDALVSYRDFISEMNVTAEKLGMSRAHYVNPHGLSNAGHVITANDLARLSAAAMKYPLFRTIVATRQFGCVAEGEQGYRRNVVWKNTNALLGFEGYKGIKTGTTSAAGACLVSATEREGDKLIAVVLGSSSTASRYADTRNLIRWAWQRRAKQ
jgi:D-alanyl-D-alanine carboxypeptidase (penicillin-binding protein 5/6)